MEPYVQQVERVSSNWAAISPDRTVWNHPEAGRVVADRQGDWVGRARQMGGRQTFNRALSIGCGLGAHDRDLYNQGLFNECVGLDLSAGAIETARELAVGLPIRYLAADLNDAFPASLTGPFDLIYAIAALHHIDNLEETLKSIADRLAPDGLFAFQEYCGPSRLQWSDDTIWIANRLLDCLPATTRAILPKVDRLRYEDFSLGDPSEAVRSGEIMDLTRMFFDVINVREVGFTLTHPLSPIFQFLDDNDPSHVAIGKLLFAFEEILIDEGVLQADTKFVIARKRA